MLWTLRSSPATWRTGKHNAEALVRDGVACSSAAICCSGMGPLLVMLCWQPLHAAPLLPAAGWRQSSVTYCAQQVLVMPISNHSSHSRAQRAPTRA